MGIMNYYILELDFNISLDWLQAYGYMTFTF